MVEDGYEFFAKRQLVTLFSAPNYCGEFDNAGGMMSVDETLMCSFQVILMYFTTLQDENIWDFNLVTWLRLVEFTEYKISDFAICHMAKFKFQWEFVFCRVYTHHTIYSRQL